MVRTSYFHYKGAWVGSLIRELRSGKPCGMTKKKPSHTHARHLDRRWESLKIPNLKELVIERAMVLRRHFSR